MSLAKFTWERSHGADIVAEAAGNGRGKWGARAWLRSNATVVVRSQKFFESRDSAFAKADALARKSFDHVCDVNICGDWGPHYHPRTDRT
jgi:hypothetical protein